MPLKDRIKLLMLGSLGAFIIYFFVSSVPLYNDLYFSPVWSLSIEKDIELSEETIENADSLNEKSQAKLYPFLIKNKFGYFKENGEILVSQEFNGKVSASSSYWCQYSKDAQEFSIYTPDGNLATTIKDAGFPFIVKDKIYLFTPGGYGVSEYSIQGMRLWHYAHSAAITAFNASKKGVVIGYSDGKIAYLDEKGEEVFNLYPGGSTYQVILGLAISEDGSFIACVSGVEKQRVLLIRIMDRQYKIIRHEYLKGNLYRQVFVSFDSDSSCAVFEALGGIGIIDCKSYDIHFLDEDAPIIDVGDDKKKKLLSILTKKDDKCRLIMIEKPFMKIAATNFISTDAFLLQDEDKLFLGTSGKISAIEIKHR